MALGRSKITAQGRISVPAEVRRKLGVGPGSFLEWAEEGGNIVVRRAGPFSFEESTVPSSPRAFPGGCDGVRESLSNDGYFGRTAAREQHLSLRPRRARRAAFPPFTETAGRLGYTPHAHLTSYSNYGDVFAWTCLGIAVVFLIATPIPSFRRE
jgi:AbrB family looped-hinge helix DNA binding protein